MQPILIILAYLVIGTLVAAVMKYYDTDMENDLLVMFALLWPMAVVVGILTLLGKVFAKVVDGIVIAMDIAVESVKDVIKTRLPRIRWK